MTVGLPTIKNAGVRMSASLASLAIGSCVGLAANASIHVLLMKNTPAPS